MIRSVSSPPLSTTYRRPRGRRRSPHRSRSERTSTADAKPSCCPKCGAAATFVPCAACGGVIWWDLAGWTAGLSAAVAVCLLVVAYAASVWLKVGAGAALLGCVGGRAWIRVSLLRAARLRSPHAPAGEAETPPHVRLWTAARQSSSAARSPPGSPCTTPPTRGRNLRSSTSHPPNRPPA